MIPGSSQNVREFWGEKSEHRELHGISCEFDHSMAPYSEVHLISVNQVLDRKDL